VSESSRTRIPGWSNPRVDWTNTVAFRCTWEHLGVPATRLGAPMTSVGAPATSLRAPQITVISKRYFRPGRVAPSEWTGSVRAVRDTPVADHSTPGLNTTRRVAYRLPITVSLFILALSGSYFKRKLCRCDQL